MTKGRGYPLVLQNNTIEKHTHTHTYIYLIVDGNMYSFYFPFGHLKKNSTEKIKFNSLLNANTLLGCTSILLVLRLKNNGLTSQDEMVNYNWIFCSKKIF